MVASTVGENGFLFHGIHYDCRLLKDHQELARSSEADSLSIQKRCFEPEMSQ